MRVGLLAGRGCGVSALEGAGEDTAGEDADEVAAVVGGGVEVGVGLGGGLRERGGMGEDVRCGDRADERGLGVVGAQGRCRPRR